MKRREALVLTILVLATATACGPAPQTGPERGRPTPGQVEPSQAMIDQAAREFAAVRDGFLDWYLEAYPVGASELGIHTYDARLPDLSRPAIQARIDDLLDWLGDLEQVPFALMREDNRYDYAVMEYALRAALLELEEERSWANDPIAYTQTIASGISAVVKREYAPLDERTTALAARMAAAPGILEAARQNLDTPPELWTRLAIADTRGLAEYLETAVPAALEAQGMGGDAAGDGTGLETARTGLIDALREHAAWLEDDLLPRSTGTYRLGRYLLERKLLYEEHVSLGVEELDRINNEKIAEYQDRVAEVAAEIDPDQSVREVMDSVVHEFPAPDDLLATAREMMEEARAWVETSDIVTLHPGAEPVVRESPPFARDAFAYLDAPGPFESADLDAFYYITNVLPGWTEEQKRQHMSYFNYAGLLGVTLHETYPGHYVQLGFEREMESEIRRVFPPRTLIEGWAHYAEQLALDEGFHADDPVARLGQLRRALQRHARWYAALHLHAMDEPLDDVVEAFQQLAYFDEFPARREVMRATYDPTYLYYALGRMQILELREDYQAFLEEHDREYSLKEFHDRLLGLGLPVTLAREVMIPSGDERRPRRIGP